MALASVIIPCYNQGLFINETIDSVLSQTFKDFEIIVVNDGSTDQFTINIINALSHPKIKIITTSNMGLAMARNNGIKAAQGTIILPLDSDDIIAPTYLEKAVPILVGNPSIGLVYSQAYLFGDLHGKSSLPECETAKMVLRNFIINCGHFRKKDWEICGGYNPNMKYGWEDWDFWLSIIERGKKVHQIKEPLFHYRIRKKSMCRSMTLHQMAEMHTQLFNNHRDFFCANIATLFEEYYKFSLESQKTIPSLLCDKFRHPIKTIRSQFIPNKRDI
jgi:glycosyltransferase involved in cell wall biosynthesis